MSLVLPGGKTTKGDGANQYGHAKGAREGRKGIRAFKGVRFWDLFLSPFCFPSGFLGA